jgi:hypothetical protein
LKEAVDLAQQRPLETRRAGVDPSFEFTHELAWNTLRDFLEGCGVQTRTEGHHPSSLQTGLIENGETWMG